MTSNKPHGLDPQQRDDRQKALDAIAQAATDAVAHAIASSPPPLREHTFYGASAIDPRHLVTWYIFRTDAEYAEARESGLTTRIDTLTREELLRRGYPPEGIPRISVSFTSHETIQREAGGNYWHYFR